jgi:hypothetical protein
MDNGNSTRDQILNALKGKSVLKQNIFEDTTKVFLDFKDAIKDIANDLKKEIVKTDKRLVIESKDKGEFEMELKIADDTIIFIMHTDIFDFEKGHSIMQSSYIDEDKERSFCGIILVYNFLSDSFKYGRTNDVGYLIARIFINKDLHFFVEGNRQLGYLFNNFDQAVIDKAQINSIIETVILYSLEFDLHVPDFNAEHEVTVSQINEVNLKSYIATGKRLGFQFQSEDKNPVND